MGGWPFGSLLLSDGVFYGMTSQGVGYDQASWHGVVFSWNPVTGKFNNSQLHFVYGPDGRPEFPRGSLIKLGSKFYGLSYIGGKYGGGSLFEWDGTPGSTAVKVRASFISDKTLPTGSLINVGDKLYGLAAGNSTSGALFRWDPVTGNFDQTIAFDGVNGSHPKGTLTYSNGKLYGLTYSGGANGLGTLFEFDLTTGVIAKKVDFSTATGGNPYYTQLLEISSSPIDQTVHFEALADKKYGDPTFSLSATASSGLPVSYTSSDPDIAAVSSNTVTILKAGAVTITASQAGNESYYAATDVPQTLTINKATPVVSWSNPQDISYGTALSSTQLNATTSTGGIVTYTPAIGIVLPVGNNQTLALTFTPADLTNYNPVDKQVLINILDFKAPSGAYIGGITKGEEPATEVSFSML